MSAQPLHAVSTFAGIGGIDLGLQAAGIPTRLLCECDKYAKAVLARRFPGIPLYPDVRTLTADDLYAAGCDPARTVLTGGFPCQDLSVAGKRAGMGEGTRSGLYWQLDRLVGEFQPQWVVYENVPGLLSSNGGRDMGAVLTSLADRGYGFAYRVLDAQYFGLAQRRKRVVIVGRLRDSGAAPAQILFEPESGAGNPATVRKARTPTAAAAEGGVGISRAVSTRSERLDEDTQTFVVSALSASGVGTCGADDNQAQANHLIPATYQRVIRSGARDKDGNLPPDKWEHRDVAATLNGFDLGSGSRAVELVMKPGVRRLTPLECERLQGFPDNWTEGQSDSQRYRQVGNAVAVPVFEWVARRLAAVDAGTFEPEGRGW